MGFIENLRRDIEGRLITKRQEKTQEAALQATQETQRNQQQAAEREFHRKRREQAGAFRKESGIDTMLASLHELINSDPATHGQEIGRVTLFKPRGATNYPKFSDFIIEVIPAQKKVSLSSVGYSAVGELSNERIRVTGKEVSLERIEPDEDAIFDVIILGERTSSYSENHNAETDHYAIYLVTETTPDGDIVFNSNEHTIYGSNLVRDTVPRAMWKNDMGVLEDALGKAFSKPSIIHRGRSFAPSGYNSGHS